MTKVRHPESIEYAVLRCLGELGPDAADVVGKSMSHLRQCSDPDSRIKISVEDAIALDAEMRRRGHGTPMLEAFAAALSVVPNGSAEQSLTGAYLEAAATQGELARRISDGMADGRLDLHERRGIAEAAHTLKEQATRIISIVEPPAPEPPVAAAMLRRSA